MMRLEGKTALVTGAGSGIGRETAILFAEEGADVLCVDLDEAGCEKTIDLAGDAKGRMCYAKADVADSSQIEKAVEFCLDEYGKLDILSHCAGIDPGVQGQAVLEISYDLWEHVLSVNLTGTFLCSRHAIKAMLPNRQGSIINLASIAALIGSAQHAYAASKGGVIALTRAMAVTYAADGIRVNAICPGPVETPMIESALGNPQVREAWESMVPLGRVAQPGEIAQMALYLASDESSWVTGSVFTIDGGFTSK